MSTFPLALPGLPRSCQHCGEHPDHWSVVPHAGQVMLVCPACYTPLGHLIAVPADEETAAQDEASVLGKPARFGEPIGGPLAGGGALRVTYPPGSARP